MLILNLPHLYFPSIHSCRSRIFLAFTGRYTYNTKYKVLFVFVIVHSFTQLLSWFSEWSCVFWSSCFVILIILRRQFEYNNTRQWENIVIYNCVYFIRQLVFLKFVVEVKVWNGVPSHTLCNFVFWKLNKIVKMPTSAVYQPTTVTYEQQTAEPRWRCPVSYFSRRLTSSLNSALCVRFGLCLFGSALFIIGMFQSKYYLHRSIEPTQ